MRIFILNIILLCFSVSAIAEKPLVVATASIFADMTSNIGGDLIEVKTIVPIGGDPHTYEPKPSDIMLINEASLILKNGLSFEKWISELIDNSGTKAKSIIITEGIEAIGSESYENAPDPHAWMDAENGLIYAKNIHQALLDLLPEEKESLDKNLENYLEQIKKMHEYIQTKVKEIPVEQRILITSHDAFKYYGRKYGIELESILGTSTDAEAQTKDFRRINNLISKKNVPAVFIETTVNPKMLSQIAEDNNIIIGGSLYSDSLGDEDSEASSYLKMLEFNTNTIVKALSRQTSAEQLDQPSEEVNSIARLFVIIAAIFLLIIGFLVSKRIAR